MKKETWVEILVGTIILGTLAFLAVKIIDMTGTLSSVESKVTSTSDRVERIAQVLPDVGVRIAKEEIKRPIKTVVVASSPTATTGGQFEVTVSILDIASSTKWSLPVTLASKDDRRILGALAWTGAELDKNYCSFNRLQEYSRVAGVDASVPAYVDAKASFVLCSANADTYLKEVSWLGVTLQKTNISFDIEDWGTLQNALKGRQAIFRREK